MKKNLALVMAILAMTALLAACASGAPGNSSKAPGNNQALQPAPEGFVHIPGGTYTMGPADLYGATSEPAHEVTLNSFYMGILPVTQKVYIEIMGTNPCDFDFHSDTMRVEQVSWYDAIEFCNRLSQSKGLTPAYTINGTEVTWNRSANGYRLPTEAEWEYAARAGTKTPFTTSSTGELQHPWGLVNIPGDIWEWCWDWYGKYPSNAQNNPAGADSGTSRVMRAGTFSMCSPRGEVVRLRSHSDPTYGGDFIGFRLVGPGI